MARYKFTDIVDIDKLRESLGFLYRVTNLPNAILDDEGNILIASGWVDLCTKYHRVNPEMKNRCKESDAYIKSHIYEGDYAAYKCKNGLWDVAFPIVIEGDHLATFFFGQFMFEDDPPDRERFRRQAEETGIDVSEYLEALDKVPMISREMIGNIVAYFKSIAEILTDSGMNYLKLLKEMNERKNIEETLKDTSEIINNSPAVVFSGRMTKTGLLNLFRKTFVKFLRILRMILFQGEYRIVLLFSPTI